MRIRNTEIRGWYRPTILGWVVCSSYIFSVILVSHEIYTGYVTSAVTPVAGMGVVLVTMIGARIRSEQPFARKTSRTGGFSLVELLVVISIIGILSSIVFGAVSGVRGKAYEVRTKAEFRTMVNALEMYYADHDGAYPADVGRNVPPGIEEYLAYVAGEDEADDWPNAPYPGSVYDWENWAPGALNNHAPVEQIYQISVRFCDIDGNNCNFPDEEWAEGFDEKSSLYYCIEGPCRAHNTRPVDHPGYCINCND